MLINLLAWLFGSTKTARRGSRNHHSFNDLLGCILLLSFFMGFWF